MKAIFNGKTYNTDTMIEVCSRSAYNNGNYAGSTKIMQTKNGNFAKVCFSNGQDLYRNNYILPIAKDQIIGEIEGWELSDEEIASLSNIGVTSEA